MRIVPGLKRVAAVLAVLYILFIVIMFKTDNDLYANPFFLWGRFSLHL